MLPCIYKQIFHISCPCCGFQRSIKYLFQGDIVNCIKMFPILFPLIITNGIIIIYYARKKKKIEKLIVFWNTLLFIVNFIYQNVFN